MTLDLIIFRPEFFLLFGFFVLLAYGTGNLVSPISEILTVSQISTRQKIKSSRETPERSLTVDSLKKSKRSTLKPTRGPNHAVSALTVWAVLWC